jgi:hypothetical protein
LKKEFISSLKKLTVISDRANNMRSGELVWFFLVPISLINIKLTYPICVAYFRACHGKSELDDYFGRLIKVIDVLRLSMCSESIAILIQSLRKKFIQYFIYFFFLRVNQEGILEEKMHTLFFQNISFRQFHFFTCKKDKLLRSSLASSKNQEGGKSDSK